MRRAQTDKGSQLIRNLAYNPSFEAAGISSALRKNNVANPSLETSGASTVVRANLLSNPSAETSSGTVNVRTNLITNPSFEGASGTTIVRTNLFTNPGFETSSGTITVRSNSCNNPSLANDATGWVTYGGGSTAANLTTSRAAASWSTSGYSWKVEGSASSTPVMQEIGVGEYTIGAGVPISFSISAIASGTRRARIRLRFVGASTDLYSSDFTLNSSTATRMSFTATAPAGTTSVACSIKEGSGTPDNFLAGDWIAASMALVEINSLVSGPYFDGATPAVHNLASRFATSGLGSGGSATLTTGVSYAGSTWTRAATTSGTGSANARQIVSQSDLGPGGTTYTVAVTVANDQAFSQIIVLDWCDTSFQTFNIAPGEVRRIVTSGSRSTYDNVYRFADLQINQSATEGRSILFKDWVIEEGVTTGTYLPTSDFTYAWAAGVHSSTSYERAPGVAAGSQNISGNSGTTSRVYQTGSGRSGKGLKIIKRGGHVYLDYTVTGLVASTDYTISFDVFTTETKIKTIDRGTAAAPQYFPADFTTTPGTWNRASRSFTTGSGETTRVLSIAGWEQATVPDGAIAIIDNLLIERGSVASTYFDGSTTASGDFTYTWSGTANASTSYQQAPALTLWSNRWYGSSGGTGSFYQAKGGISGTYARKLWTNSNTGSTMDAGINPSSVIAISPNTPYTLSAWVRTSVAQNFNFYIEWRSDATTVVGATPVNTFTAVTANTWTRLSITGTSPANAVFALPVIGPYASALAMPSGSTMDFDNVLFEAAPAMQPYFDGSNPLGNLVPVPSFEDGSTGWINNTPDMVNSSAASYVGTKSVRVTPTSENYGYYNAMPLVKPGSTYTFSIWVKSDSAQSMALTNYNTPVVGPSVSVQAGQWTRLYLTQTIPLNATNVWLSVRDPARVRTLTPFYMDAFMIEESPNLNPYYEGTGDYTYVWSGAANASTSYQQAPGVSGTGMASVLSYAYQSKTNGITSGTKSVRITPTHVSNGDSFFDVNGMLGGFTFKANTTYTISGNRTILAPQTNLNGTTGFRISIGSELTPTLVSPIANVAGTQRVVARFTTGASTAVNFVRFYNGSYFGGGDVWWDDLMLEEGITNGQYFDGSNPIQNLITNSSFESNTSNWWPNTGTPTLTSSTEQAWIGTRSLKAVSTVSSSDIAVTFNPLTLQPSTTYTFSWYVYSPDARTAYFDLSAPSPSFSLNNQGSKAIPANTWTRVSGTFTTPRDLGGNVEFYLHHGGGPTAIGTAIWIDAVLLEKATTLNPYYAGTGDFTYSWWSTANASGSNQSAPSVAERQSINGSTTTVYQSSVRAFSGSKSGAIFTKGSVPQYVTMMYPISEYMVGNTAGLLAPSTKYTYSLYVWVPSGSGTVRLEDAYSSAVGSPNTLFDQWERISLTFPTGGAGANTSLRLRSATVVPAQTVIWWDNELLEQSPSIAPYFDGSTASTSDFTYSWNGTANASPSIQTVTMINNTSNNYNSAIVDAKFYKYQSIAEDGKKIARWVAPAGTPSSAWRIAGIPPTGFDFSSLKAGGRYTLFFRWRSSGWIAANQMVVAIQDATAQNPVIGFDSGNALNQTGWQEYRRTFTALRDATSASMLYISLPTTPHSTTDGIFDMRDWMLVEGEYTGDYVDGSKPLSKWSGTANASPSLGYPPQLIDIAGAPMAALYTEGTTLAPITGGAFDDCTVYHVYEVYNPLAEWTSTASIGGWIGGSADYASKGAFTYGRRNGGDLATSHTRVGNSANNNVSGMGSAVPGLIQGFKPNQRHVVTMQLTDGASILRSTINGGPEAAFGFSTGNGIAREAIKMRTGVSNTDGTASTAAKGLVLLYFPGRHSDTTRLTMSRYLGNKYGANVA